MIKQPNYVSKVNYNGGDLTMEVNNGKRVVQKIAI